MEDRQFSALDLRLEKLRQRRQGEDPRVTAAFQEGLDIGWIYHDSALEGTVLSYQEIKAAFDEKTELNGRMGAVYSGIRDHKAAIDFVKGFGRAQPDPVQKRGMITGALLKHLYELLTPADKPKGSPYRQDRPLQRIYHHEIVAADRIPQCIRKLCDSLNEEPSSLHPLARAASVHFELMAIYPWARNSGKVARLLMNLLLLRDGYPPAVIPGAERLRYYESLRDESDRLADLVTDTLHAYCDSATQFFNELARLRKS